MADDAQERKNSSLPPEQRRAMIETTHPQLSVLRQCQLIGLSRSSYYYKPVAVGAQELALRAALDRAYTCWPFYGSRRLTWALQQDGFAVGRKRVQGLMRDMGLEALYPKPRLSLPGQTVTKYPYLLRGISVVRPNHVWAVDITYVPLTWGWMYLVALLDWYSRYVLAWRLSNTLETTFCLEALDEALATHGAPQIHNNDQGAQFTSAEYVGRLTAAGIQISWDGRGRVYDNIYVERFWRTVKYEHLYLQETADGSNLNDFRLQQVGSIISMGNGEKGEVARKQDELARAFDLGVHLATVMGGA